MFSNKVKIILNRAPSMSNSNVNKPQSRGYEFGNLDSNLDSNFSHSMHTQNEYLKNSSLLNNRTNSSKKLNESVI